MFALCSKNVVRLVLKVLVLSEKPCANPQSRLRKRNEPSAPESDQSSVCSGGLANIMKSRAVSAPYFSIRSCGSTPLLFDFDIVPRPSDSTGLPAALPHFGHVQSTNDGVFASGLPVPSGTRFSGSTTGRSLSGTGTSPQASQRTMGIGVPQ